MKDYMQLKQKVFNSIIQAELATYMTCYGPDKAVISISNLMLFQPEITKYAMRKVLKELIADGVVEYTSQGCPAIESIGEYTELICDAAPPVNGYALTKAGFESDEWKTAYDAWCKALKEMSES